jgi:hypothetical protein
VFTCCLCGGGRSLLLSQSRDFTSKPDSPRSPARRQRSEKFVNRLLTEVCRAVVERLASGAEEKGASYVA